MDLLEQLRIGPEFLLAAGIALLTYILMRRAFRQRRSSSLQPMERPERLKTGATTLLDAPQELVRWQVEMHETARDLKAELDSKMSALQTLLLMAQQERQKLEALLERAEHRAANISVPADQPMRPAAGSSETSRSSRSSSVLPGNERQRSEVYAMAERGASPPEIAERLGVPIGEIEFLLALRAR